GVIITGDIMVDAVLQNVEKAQAESTIHARTGIHPDQPYAAVTIHRPANTDNPVALRGIIDGLNALDLPVIFPVHPRTQKTLENLNIPTGKHVQFIEPLAYLDMLRLLDCAAVLLTDSGGLQKESYILRTPCVTIRPETEWVETVASGWNRLTAPEPDAIVAAVHTALNSIPASHPDFYGDGSAARQMVNALENYPES
ncbi:MAG TPA: UDP-N-acetylglucosamine 2-epimerase, partial [Aggregatilineales bacterium]|nr:UDP-N-acetylglucosamine 2-epimerase [Aggregatilineales bacterium]